MRRLLKVVFGLVILGGVGYGAFLWLWPKPAGAATRDQDFQAEVAAMEDVLLVAGVVKPAVTIDLRAEASGIVEYVAVKEGDRVAAGQELVRLDSKLAKSALDQAEANLKQAELQDEATKLDLDEDGFAARKKSLERAQALFAQGLLPRDQLEQRELEYRSAERALARASRNIESSQARITQVRAAVDQARTQLLHTTIRAPFDAIVLRRAVEVGSGVAGVSQSASGGSVLMTLGDARESALYARATAADARRLHSGQAARVRLDSDASQQLPAEVRSVSTAGDVDQSTRLTTFPIVIALKSQPPGGWVNVPAQAEIVLASTVDSVVVPERCVQTDPAGRSYVRLRAELDTRYRSVEVGVVQKDKIQIRSGLDKGPDGRVPDAIDGGPFWRIVGLSVIARNVLGEAMTSLRMRRLQALLSSFGIATGIAAVVLLVSIVSGIHRFAIEQMGAVGGNLIQVTTSAQRSTRDPRGFQVLQMTTDAGARSAYDRDGENGFGVVGPRADPPAKCPCAE
jgi:HlyD family secretion protein